MKIKVEATVYFHPRIGQEGSEGEYRYSSTLSLTSALDGVGGQPLRFGRFTPRGKRPGTHCIGGWLGSRAGLDGCGKYLPHRDSIPGPSSCSESLYRLSYRGPPYEDDKLETLVQMSIIKSCLSRFLASEVNNRNSVFIRRQQRFG